MPDKLKLSEDEGRMILNGINGVGPVILSRLLERFSNDPWKILQASQSALNGVRGVGSQLAENINCAQSSDWLEKEKVKLGKIGATFISGSNLPNFLEELDDPPIGLYCLGEVPSLPCISIVGTRVPSLYGKKMARQLAKELAGMGTCIVSGMARGIDTEAHLGALDAGGKTIAFLGSGLDVIYPPENLNLYQRIAQSGAVLSEFPLGRKADRRTFPMRNRLVAGVSLGVVVIESAKAGGSMITARFAAEQGRTVFAVPGRVDHPESMGCLSLIRDGATLIRSVDDILEELAPMIGSVSAPQNPAFPTGTDLTNLEIEEQKIIQALSAGEILDMENLHKICAMPLAQTMASLTMLEIQGLVQKRTDGRYELA